VVSRLRFCRDGVTPGRSNSLDRDGIGMLHLRTKYP
jgi:hypothetical protein